MKQGGYNVPGPRVFARREEMVNALAEIGRGQAHPDEDDEDDRQGPLPGLPKDQSIVRGAVGSR